MCKVQCGCFERSNCNGLFFGNLKSQHRHSGIARPRAVLSCLNLDYNAITRPRCSLAAGRSTCVLTQQNQTCQTATMNYSAVIFDLDGTLLDSLADIANSANEVLASCGFPTHSHDAFRRFVGDGVSMLFTRALPVAAQQIETIARCVELHRVAYSRRWNDQSRPYPGVFELLSMLNARGVRLAVLSNKPQPFTEKCVGEFFPETRFEIVLGQREGVPRKPDPAGAVEILQRLNLPAAKVAFLGDSDVDMQTAIAAHVHPIGALWGFRSQAELTAAGAAQIIHHPLELLMILEN